MALATPTMENLTCNICLQFFRDPKVLPCQHIFCQRCLQAMTLKSVSRSMKCPTCKQRTTIPEGGVVNFPTQLFIADEVVRYNAESKPDVCDAHPRELAQFVCSTCNVTICAECRNTLHLQHSVLDIDDVISRVRVDLQDDMVRLMDSKCQLESTLKKVAANRDAAMDKRKALEIILRDRKRRAQQMVEDTFAEAMLSLEIVTNEVNTVYEEDKAHVQERLQTVTNLQGKVKRAFQTGVYREVKKLQEVMDSGTGSVESLRQLTSDLPLRALRPLLLCDDNCPLADILKLFIGHMVAHQPILESELPEVDVKLEFRCFEDEHEDVHAMCPTRDGLVWVAHGFTVTHGKAKEGWIGLHTNSGAIEKREVVVGRVCIALLTDSMVIVEGRHYKAQSMSPTSGAAWSYTGTELLYRVYSKFQARFFIGVGKSGECDLRSVKVLDGNTLRTKATKLVTVRAKTPVAMDACSNGRLFAVLEEGENHVLLFHLNEKARFVTYLEPSAVYKPDSSVFAPRDVCFYKLGGQERLVVADWQGDSLHVLAVAQNGSGFTFLGHLAAGSPLIVKPSALTVDESGRLWVGCRFGYVMTVTPRK